jgi:hypothetical protein
MNYYTLFHPASLPGGLYDGTDAERIAEGRILSNAELGDIAHECVRLYNEMYRACDDDLICEITFIRLGDYSMHYGLRAWERRGVPYSIGLLREVDFPRSVTRERMQHQLHARIVEDLRKIDFHTTPISEVRAIPRTKNAYMKSKLCSKRAERDDEEPHPPAYDGAQ